MRIKKHHFLYYCIIAVFIFSFSFGSTLIYIVSNSPNPSQAPNTAENGVSHYDIKQSIKYDVEVNLTVTQTNIGMYDYYFKMPRIDDRSPNSSMAKYCPPYQEAELLYSDINYDGSSYSYSYINDRFNNTYDNFEVSLTRGEYIKYSQNYNVTLNQVSFSGISDSDIGEYNDSDIIFDLYGNHSVKFFNTSNHDLISLSNSLVDENDNPVEKARNIVNWVSSNIEHEDQTEERGATWAYENRKGDCSDFSDLAITLLRIQGIPARKVTGFINPHWHPNVGDTFTYTAETAKRHAWFEYYVPEIGWIACDADWNQDSDYFNQIDYIRFGFTVGSWIENAIGENKSEFDNPNFGYSGFADFDFDYEFKVTILETNVNRPPDIWEIIIIITVIVGIIGAVALTIYLVIKVRQRRETSEVSYY